MSAQLACPECGMGYNLGSAFCRRCGTRFAPSPGPGQPTAGGQPPPPGQQPAGPLRPPRSVPVGRDGRQVRCTTCQSINDAQNLRCLRCGNDLR